MYSVHVCSTNDRELPPPEIGPGLNWDRLTEILLREVSADAAGLLAEPIRDDTRGQTHWHIAARDDPMPIAALSDDERDKLLLRLDERRREIERFAASVEAEGGDANQRLAAALRIVLNVPDEHQHVWSADGKPVLTAWGRAPASRRAPVTRVVKRPPAAPVVSTPEEEEETAGASIQGRSRRMPPLPPPPPLPPGVQPTAAPFAASPGALPPPRRPLWPAILLWSLFVVLVAGSYLALLPACGLHAAWFGLHSDHCDFGKSPEVLAAEMRNYSLRELIKQAELKVAQNRAACTGPQRTGLLDTPRTQERQPPLLDSKEAEQRRKQAAGTHGKLDITLVWNGREDLDLHVYCPGGQIFFNYRSACGGTLEIDRNSTLESAEDHPIEHVTWHEAPPAGDYRVEVVLFDRFNLPERAVPFTVVVRDASGEHEYPGQVDKMKDPVTVATFTH